MAVQLILASQSPRRASLLDSINVRFRIQPADIDESVQVDEPVVDYVRRMAREKAESLGAQDAPVLAADTTVVCNECIFGKPRDKHHAMEMLAGLSGNTHQVLTALYLVNGETCHSILSVSQVKFRILSKFELENYWHTGEPADKAGAYAIQGIGAIFVERIEGSHSGIMGLPLCETEALLRKVGINTWQHRV